MTDLGKRRYCCPIRHGFFLPTRNFHVVGITDDIVQYKQARKEYIAIYVFVYTNFGNIISSISPIIHHIGLTLPHSGTAIHISTKPSSSSTIMFCNSPTGFSKSLFYKLRLRAKIIVNWFFTISTLCYSSAWVMLAITLVLEMPSLCAWTSLTHFLL